MIRSDKWITRQCVKPTHRLINALGGGHPLIRPPYSESEQQAINNWDPESGHERFVKQPYAVPLHDFDGELLKWQPMIEPFVENLVRLVKTDIDPIPVGRESTIGAVERKVSSYGTSCFGYDVRLADEFKLFTNLNSTIIDPKRFDEKCLVDADLKVDEDGDKYVILPPNSYLLGRTVEYFRIPRDVMVICVGKSTYARAGAIVNVTPIEAGFEGNVVIEIGNSTNLPLKIYAGEGIAQFMFFQSDEECKISYKDRQGKYQSQTGITLPKA